MSRVYEKHLKFKYMNFIDVDIQLKKNYTVIDGDSATGKSYLYDVINQYAIDEHRQDIMCINLYTDLSSSEIIYRIKELKDSIIIIDMADSLFNRLPSLKSFIERDRNNYYIIMSRTFAKQYTELAWLNISKKSMSIQYKMDLVS